MGRKVHLTLKSKNLVIYAMALYLLNLYQNLMEFNL